MKLEYLILAAFLLDLFFGHPWRMLHSGEIIGCLAVRLAGPFRRIYGNEFLAGVMTFLAVLTTIGGAVVVLVVSARKVSPLLGDVVSIMLLYSTFSARDLARQALDVYDSLNGDETVEGPRSFGSLIGPDTDLRDGTQVAAAAVAGVAEHTVITVTAPLFYALLGGPLGALLYRAVNTLGFIHGRERFGRAAAYLDDLLTYPPALITGWCLSAAAALMNLDARRAFRTMSREAVIPPRFSRGYTVAAIAGALGIRLEFGHSSGRTANRLPVGEGRLPETADIRRVVTLSGAAATLFLVIGVFVRSAF